MPKVFKQMSHINKLIGHFFATDVFMVTFASFIVISKHAESVNNESLYLGNRRLRTLHRAKSAAAGGFDYDYVAGHDLGAVLRSQDFDTAMGAFDLVAAEGAGLAAV